MSGCGQNEQSALGLQGSENVESDDAIKSSANCPLYPIVFHHGFMGGNNLGFFKDAIKNLESIGCKAFELRVDAIESVEVRGQELADQVSAILEKTGAGRVNLVAHSQGGLDSRYAISVLNYGEKIASLSTLGTPHYGTPLADLALRIHEDSPEAFKKAAASILKLISDFNGAKTDQIDLDAALESLSVENVSQIFNKDVKNDDRVYYQSWAGVTGGKTKDKVKLNLLPSQIYLQKNFGENDGVVTVESAKWGDFKGVLEADHLDLIGSQFADKKSPFKLGEFIKGLAKDLASRGL